jgi:hypothetical protein
MPMLADPPLPKIHTFLDIKQSHNPWVAGCQLPHQLSESHLNLFALADIFQHTAKFFPHVFNHFPPYIVKNHTGLNHTG